MIDSNYFTEIINELITNPLPVSNYRQKCSTHKQSVFGVLARRNVPADYSKLCASHPTLYKHLLEFGKQFAGIPYSSIIISEGYTPIHKRLLKDVVGVYTVITFDKESGGTPGTLTRYFNAQSINVNTQYALIYYTIPSNVPPPSVVSLNGADVFMRGSEPIIYTGRKLKKEISGIWIEHKDAVVNFP